MGVAVHPHVTDHGYDYNGGTPFDIQRTTVELLTENHRAYVLSSMGTGKTKCVCWSYDYLRRVSSARKMLVVCPLSTMRFTWQREIFMTTPGYKTAILHGSRDQRHELLADKTVDIYIINHDGLEIVADAVAKRDDIDVIVLDELATYRNNTNKTKVAIKLCTAKPIVWGLTGAPTPNAPTDVFQQAKILTPGSVPKYFSHFRDMTMVRINQFRWVPKAEHEDGDGRPAAQRAVHLGRRDGTAPFISHAGRRRDGPNAAQKLHAAVKRDTTPCCRPGPSARPTPGRS